MAGCFGGPGRNRRKMRKRYSFEVKKYGLFWLAFVARTLFLTCVDRKVLRRANIILGRRNSCWLVASVWLEIRLVKRIPERFLRFSRKALDLNEAVAQIFSVYRTIYF
jgi:hypothetical protein